MDDEITFGEQLGINSIYRAAKSRNRISRKEGRGLKMMGEARFDRIKLVLLLIDCSSKDVNLSS